MPLILLNRKKRKKEEEKSSRIMTRQLMFFPTAEMALWMAKDLSLPLKKYTVTAPCVMNLVHTLITKHLVLLYVPFYYNSISYSCKGRLWILWRHLAWRQSSFHHCHQLARVRLKQPLLSFPPLFFTLVAMKTPFSALISLFLPRWHRAKLPFETHTPARYTFQGPFTHGEN